WVEWFDELVVGPGTKSTDLLLDLALGREHDDWHVRGAGLLLAHLLGDLIPVELGLHDVQQDEIGDLLTPQSEPFGAVPRDDDVIALLLQRVLEQSLDVRIVIDDEDLGCHLTSRASPRGAPGSTLATPASRVYVAFPVAQIVVASGAERHP